MKKYSNVISSVGIAAGLVLLAVGALMEDWGGVKAYGWGLAFTIIGPIVFIGSLVWKSKQKPS